MANSPARTAVDVGTVIADTYVIEAMIGRGGMGTVFLASHTRLPGKRVAIKFLHVEDADVIARFKREAHIATKLDHPNIVRVDDYNVTDDGTPYVILEYLEGESLAERLKAGPLPLEQVMAIMRMVGSAVAAAHRASIVHRDLKPQNIFLMQTVVDGHSVEVAKVLDFGISKILGASTVKTQESTLLGTPQYMAPEQATGQHASVDERTDLFALGAIVYEMLTGTPAFSGENIPEVVFKVVYEQPRPLAEVAPGLPATVVAAVERAMMKQQDDRFPSVDAFVEALTGRPLAQQRTAMISLPPGERSAPTTTTTGKRAGQAAFANTVDSGNVDKSIVKPPATVSPHAETVASHRGDTPIPVAPRSMRLVVGLAITTVLGIGLAIFFATRGGDKPKAQPIAIADAAVAIDAAPMAEVDAAVAAAADAAIDAAVAVKSPPDAPKSSGGRTVGTKPDDALAAASLAQAKAELGKGNVDLARQATYAVTNNDQASPQQVHKALLIRGDIDCNHTKRIGDARADLRAMSIAAYRAQLLKICPQLR